MAAALAAYKRYIDFYKKEFDSEQFETIQQLEAKYQDEKKDKELKLLQARNEFRKKQNYLYLGIAVAALLGLIFLFLAYHFRLRYSIQREKLLKQEKQEAEWQTRLKEEETARLVVEQKLMQRELLAGALQVEHKNELLQSLKNKLLEHPDSGTTSFHLEKIMNDELRTDEDFENIKSEFKDIHPGFFNKLQQNALQKLTPLDLKYCAYILMGLSPKQIASLLHIEPKSVRMTRYRLKQKLGLDKETNLDEYIGGLG